MVGSSRTEERADDLFVMLRLLPSFYVFFFFSSEKLKQVNNIKLLILSGSFS
jgi:hypothetical protein